MGVQTVWRNVSSEAFFTKATGLLWFLLIVAMATGLRYELTKAIGSLALSAVSILAPILALFVLKKDQNRQDLKGFFIGIGLLLVLYLLPRGSFDSYPASLRRAIQIAVVASVYTAFFYSATSSDKWKALVKWNRISLIPPAILLCYVLLTEPLSFRGWSLGFQNPNVAGMALVSLWPSLMLLREKPRWWQISMTSLILLFLIFSTSSRASMVGLLVASFLFLLTGRRVFAHLRWVTLATILALPILVVAVASLSSWHGNSELDQWLATYMGKSLFSGRNELWGQALSEVRTSLVFGLGGGAQLQAANGLTLSIHNLFLQTIHQTGIVGLGALIWVLYSIWPKASSTPALSENHISRVATAFGGGILFIQIFEITLTQNNLTLGLPFWAVMGFAAGYNRRQRSTANKA